jgi:hypothetical protein
MTSKSKSCPRYHFYAGPLQTTTRHAQVRAGAKLRHPENHQHYAMSLGPSKRRRAGAAKSDREDRAQLNRAGSATEDVAPLLNGDRAGVGGVLGSAADVGNVPIRSATSFCLCLM